MIRCYQLNCVGIRVVKIWNNTLFRFRKIAVSLAVSNLYKNLACTLKLITDS